MRERQVDVAIIGAGTAGLYALSEVKRLGLSWVMIQGGPEGTTCARVGCMPSKLLLNVAEHFHALQEFDHWGLKNADSITVDPKGVMRYVRSMRDKFVAGVTSRTTERMDDTHLIRGYAKFTAPNTLEVEGRERIQAKQVILATGSSPLIPDAWSAYQQHILTTDDLFEQETLPKSLAIIGLGAIGLEIGQAMSQLGVEVTGFDLSERVGGITDPEIAEQAIETFNGYFPMHLGQGVTLGEAASGVQIESGDTRIIVEKVLFAAGRRPNLSGLALENAGVSLDEKGRPDIDTETMQIKGHPIYLAGDLTGERAVMHEASDEGLMAGFNVAQTDAVSFKRKTPLGIVFTAPNIARVGQSYAEIDLEESLVVNQPVASNGRARVKHQTAGSISLYIDKKTGELLGSELFCVDAEHLAHQLCWVIEQRLGIAELVKMPVYHPVVEEALMAVIEKASHKLAPDQDNAERKLRKA